MDQFCAVARSPGSQLMMSAVVRVKGQEGNFVEARALLDTCSTAHFITEKLVRRLGLSGRGDETPISAINNVQATSKGNVDVIIRSRLNDHQRILKCLIVPKIAGNIPSEVFPRDLISIPSNIRLADPAFHTPCPVDLLIGSGPTMSFLSIGQINLSRDNCDLYLQKTLLGWVIVGGIDQNSKSSVTCNVVSLKDQLSKFWEIEEIVEKPPKSQEEAACEAHYSANVRRDSNGRYVVKLPFKSSKVNLGNSKSKAFQRFKNLEKKFQTDTNFREKYTAVMQNYLDSGHMTLVANDKLEGHYLPHHAVFKPDSNSTKTRVVFDASAKTDNGTSLNDHLMVGPTIQPKLFEILLRFRSYPYVMTADIEQMYRQVLLDPEERRFQCIFWYHKNSIGTFELNTVTFGVASAPFLAVRTLHQLAQDERDNYPLAHDVIKNNFYVDDMLAGANSLDEMLQVRNEIIQMLRRGGFHIRKWSANHSHVLDDLEEKIHSVNLGGGADAIHKTLGIKWNSEIDQFVYSTRPIELSNKITKRQILSEVAKIFDPLGLLGPVVLYAKWIMQDCWKAKVGWDETVPQDLHSKWSLFANQLSLLQNVSVPRFLLLADCVCTEIHGFCDASQVGYGAALYVRSIGNGNQTLIRLICSKSRVAPVKQVTLPKLELCGALTLVRLFKECRSSFTFPIDRIVFWCDSEIVLLWLKRYPNELQTFIGNRVAEIQNMTEEVEWRHVAGKDNIADRISRGQLPSKFLSDKDWIDGPFWLRLAEDEWPRSPNNRVVNLPGLKSESCLLTVPVEGPFYQKFSSYNKLLRIIAYCLRWRYPGSKTLKVSEKERAEKGLMLWIQREHYQRELDKLKGGNAVKSFKIRKLSPFLDKHGLMRVGGRLRHANISEGQKFPILLPADNHVTDLIIEEAHKLSLHSGVQGTLYLIRNKFWLLDGKHRIRRIIRACLNCIRHRPEILQAKMSDLPKVRVEQSAVFSHVGIDYFGPIMIKEKKFRNRVVMKAYGCLFICMATKAVHIEIVSDLSTESFLGSLRRFIGRRGNPTDIYSDNGTNFIGAHNELQELYALLNSACFKGDLQLFNLNHHITWHFNPPVSPHFGGIWEAAVKSAKQHLKRVVGGQLLTFEQLSTLAVEIEAVLNSRPISAMSSDPNDPEALTPAHFLIGRSMLTLPERDLLTIPDNRLSSWRFISKARQDFWKRWHLEYLSELQRRQKWLENKGEINRGAVVLVIEKEAPCNQWPLGVITEVYPGSDGVIRVVKIKTSQGEYMRNITKLCLLPHISS